ncbi:hypothetical protein ACT3TS_06215 [Specibacter sp. AOP5-B1-6]|uniref:hypothetical protein n=1 Tax=Specibacter sp. AOP5-B1-6 TaxID=3457653 RepID=UPI003FB80AED
MRMHAQGRPAGIVGRLATVGILAASLALAGCGISLGVPDASPEPAAPSSSATTPEQGAGSTAEPSPSNVSSGGASASPTAEAVAKQWKIFTDPGKAVSFELPQQWTVQVLAPPSAGALRLEVRDPQARVMATLNTHITGLGGACQPDSSRPYTVLASIPMAIPSNNEAPTAVEPRYVYRIIQGATHHFASYGITDHSAGTDGKACLVYNTVTSEKLGIYMFGDVLQFSSAADGSPGLRAFATIADAQAYMLTSEYQNIQKMVTSLQALG